MGLLDTLKKNKDYIFSYIVIIFLIILIVALYNYSKKSSQQQIIQAELSQNNIIKSNTVDFSGNFGINIKKEADKINISEYMSDEN